ncbi:A-agglutinin anchorage subunit-like [Oreochromis aureus]|uniref:A-agglutinin anchorage subunit-like n=1 Tax=Oreochromis aureus TaxID=47969 RepID=UPI0019530B9F|nr:A-agglutinin anchorage subunit-like [Oreochromis aureus]
MKLGLLVVVAVAVLLPSFTESRLVSKCELKDKLANAIRLPRRLEESVLPIIVCELERISHLNTSLVNVFGKHITTILKPTVVTTPSTTAVTLTTTGGTTLTSTNSATTDLTKTTTTATATTATSTAATSTATTTAAATSTATTAAATSAATTAAATSAAATTAATSTAATSTATTTTTVTTTSPAITSSTSTSRMKRRKRHAHSSSEEEIGQIGGEMDDSSEEDSKENTKPLSLGLYGLFQLSDSLFCNSGLRPSRNICRTSCNSFTDNNIADDIACFINTGYWRNIVQRASRSCRRTSNLFRECK